MQDSAIFWLGFVASLLAGLGAAFGAAWVLVFKRPSPRMQDGLLSAAAGVMLAATFFSLLQPALAHAEAHIAFKPGAVALVIAGVLGGAAMLFVAHRCHRRSKTDPPPPK